MTQKKKATKKATKAPEKKKRAPVGELQKIPAPVVSVLPRQEAPAVEDTGLVEEPFNDGAVIVGGPTVNIQVTDWAKYPEYAERASTLLREALPFLEELCRQSTPERQLRIRALMDRIEAEVGET